MKSLTYQEIFNKSVAGLASQGFQPSTSGDMCVYKDDRGFKCAIGHLIADAAYKPSLEGQVPENALALSGYLVDGESPADNRHFLDMLQVAHDRSPDASTMKEKLKLFAADFELDVPPELL
jgi:hypothetical protein